MHAFTDPCRKQLKLYCGNSTIQKYGRDFIQVHYYSLVPINIKLKIKKSKTPNDVVPPKQNKSV